MFIFRWVKKILSSFTGGTLTGAIGGKLVDLAFETAQEQVEELSKDQPHDFLDTVLVEMRKDMKQYGPYIAVINRRYRMVMRTKREDLWEIVLEKMLLDPDGKTFDMQRAIERLCVYAALSDDEFDMAMRMRIDTRPENLKQRILTAIDTATTALSSMNKSLTDSNAALDEEITLRKQALYGATRAERREAQERLAALEAEKRR